MKVTFALLCDSLSASANKIALKIKFLIFFNVLFVLHRYLVLSAFIYEFIGKNWFLVSGKIPHFALLRAAFRKYIFFW